MAGRTSAAAQTSLVFRDEQDQEEIYPPTLQHTDVLVTCISVAAVPSSSGRSAESIDLMTSHSLSRGAPSDRLALVGMRPTAYSLSR